MVTMPMSLDDAKSALVCAEQDLESIKIENNYEPGDRLEPEGKIAERFRVNRHTLRRSIDELVEQGKLRPIIDQAFLLTELPSAHALSQKGRTAGKIIITVNE